MLISDDAIDIAVQSIAPHVLRTPLVPSYGLSAALGTHVFLKCELFQPTGSFKVRGVFNKASTMTEDERSRGLIAFSAGNHAMAVAHVGAGLGLPVTVCMPAGSVQFKIDAVRSMGASLELVEGDLVAHALARQEELGATLVHPFDDPAVVAGTATLGREVMDQLPDVDTVLVPLGGGGLISGVATAVKRANPNVRVIGIEPNSADVVTQSRAAGRPIQISAKSLADGLAAPVTGEINLAHIDEYVDEVVLVDEADIRPAWQEYVDLSKLAAEPASAVPLAAIRSGAVTVEPDERVCMLVCGGNADFATLYPSDD
jgi:threonine dehydratase